MIFVDTSALFALLNPDDDANQRARRSWEAALALRESLVTTNYVEVEAISLLQRRAGMAAIARLRQALRPCRVHWIDRELHVAATELFLEQNRRKLSIVDCTSILVMQKLAIGKAFAFDKHFAEFGFAGVE